MPPIRRPVTPDQALVRLETLCAKAEHCTHEIRTKLERWAIPAGDADAIITRLKQNKYIDDERFARAFVNDKIQFAGWGRRKIAQALYLKRISRDIINSAFVNVDEKQYLQKIEDCISHKMRSVGEQSNTYEGRTKVFRHAVSRGYEPDLVAQILRKLINNQ